jgi:DNA mismatch repair protein MutL
MLQVPPASVGLMEKLLPQLTDMGFDLTDLGSGSYAVNGVPAGVEGLDYVQLVTDIIDDAREKVSGTIEEIHQSLALSLARNMAIPYGQVLSNEEMEHVVNSLFACSNVNYTPDGKTILGILKQQEIEQLLG